MVDYDTSSLAILVCEKRAESAWQATRMWRRVWLACHVFSCLAFLFGFGWPLTLISMGHVLVP